VLPIAGRWDLPTERFYEALSLPSFIARR